MKSHKRSRKPPSEEDVFWTRASVPSRPSRSRFRSQNRRGRWLDEVDWRADVDTARRPEMNARRVMWFGVMPRGSA